MKRFLLFFGVTTSVLSVAYGQTNPYRGKRLPAYFEEWSIYGANYNIADVQNSGAAARLTHLLYAFGNVSATGSTASCAIADAWADYQTPYLPPVNGIADTGPVYGNFAEMQKLKQLNPGLRILISLGGASAANTAAFATAASTPALRSQLATSCIDMFVKGNVAPGISVAGLFDGIDLDWEFPGAADKTNFTALVTEFRKQLDALGKGYELTFAAPAGSQNYSNIQLGAVAKLLDFVNLQTYDYHGTWETTTNNAAPLFDSPNDPSFSLGFYTDATVNAYLSAGVPAGKIVLGVPFYGRGWTGVPDVNHGLYQGSTGAAPSPANDTLQTPGVATFRSLDALTGYQRFWQPISLSHWIYSSVDGTFWSYDDRESVRIKIRYVKQNGLGGAYGWALKDDDAASTLVTAMSDGLSFGR